MHVGVHRIAFELYRPLSTMQIRENMGMFCVIIWEVIFENLINIRNIQARVSLVRTEQHAYLKNYHAKVLDIAVVMQECF